MDPKEIPINLVDVFQAQDALSLPGFDACAAELNAVWLARILTGLTGFYRCRCTPVTTVNVPNGNLDVHILQVVLPCAL